MTKVVTYQLAYRTHAEVSLCDRCMTVGDHEWGALGHANHGLHRGACEGLHHPGESPEWQEDTAAGIDAVYGLAAGTTKP